MLFADSSMKTNCIRQFPINLSFGYLLSCQSVLKLLMDPACINQFIYQLILNIRMHLDIDFSDLLLQGGLYLFLALFVGMSQAAGLGGGPILNITLIMGFGYSTTQSMAITYIFLMGGALASIYSNYGKLNKNKTKKLIDENLVILTLPMTVSGSVIGAMLNHFISELVLAICLVALLAILAKSNLDQYKESIAQASRKEAASKEVLLLTKKQQKAARSRPPLQLDEEGDSSVSESTYKSMDPELKKIVAEELKPMRYQTISLYLQILAICLLAMLVKGGTSYESIIGIPKCSWASQIVVIILLAITYQYARYIFKKQYKSDIRKEELGYVFKNEEDKMSVKYFKNSLFLGFCAGCVGGMLGIGGASILIPAWQDCGIDQDTASSSTAPLIFTSAFISMFIAFLCDFYSSFVVMALYFVMAFCASYFVKKIVNQLKERYKMEGIVFMFLYFLMLAAMVFFIPYELNKMYKNPQHFFAFGQFC